MPGLTVEVLTCYLRAHCSWAASFLLAQLSLAAKPRAEFPNWTVGIPEESVQKLA